MGEEETLDKSSEHRRSVGGRGIWRRVYERLQKGSWGWRLGTADAEDASNISLKLSLKSRPFATLRAAFQASLALLLYAPSVMEGRWRKKSEERKHSTGRASIDGQLAEENVWRCFM